MNVHPIILAGGFGRRLAPVSTPYKPKQFHDLLGHGETLLQATAKRALMFAEPSEVITIGNIAHEEHLDNQLYEINSDLLNMLIFEDEPKNTAYAVNLALSQIEGDAVVIILPADHYIQGNFYDDVAAAANLALQNKIVTFGIMPEFPSTNYGYLLGSKFIEKPDYASALSLLRQGALWNSGIFVARADILRWEFAKYYQDLSANLPFDKAIMEQTKRMEVIRAHFNWDDLGSFESLEKYENGARIRLAS